MAKTSFLQKENRFERINLWLKPKTSDLNSYKYIFEYFVITCSFNKTK